MSNLRAHKKRVHEKTKDVNHPTLACGLCDYKTTVKFNLERHSDKCEKSVQANPIDLSCKVCHKKYSTKKILNKHAKLHDKQVSDSQPSTAVSCVVCKKTFVNRWNMDRHKKNDHGLTERGNVVENSLGIALFTTEALVKETVIKTRPEKVSHQCNQCEYQTSQRSHLSRHKHNKHNGPKPEMRGRKRKTGPLSRTTQYRRAAENPNKLTQREVSYLGKNVRMSERDLLKVLKFTKHKSGSSFEGNLCQFFKEKKRILQGYFKTVPKDFLEKKGKVIERNLTCTKDMDFLIEKVIEMREIRVPLILVGCDGGMGSFLVTLAIIDQTKNYKLEQFKPTGFPRLLVPAKVRDIPENTHNLRTIFDEMKINEVSKRYKIVGDLKVYNMLLGMQSSGSLHPCPYGLCYKVDQHGQKTNQRGSWVKGENRTLEGNAEEARAYAETTQNRATLQYFFNCEFEPVIRVENPTRVLDILAIPALHTVLLGPFNTLWKSLSDHFSTEAEAFAVHFGMKGAGKGGDFNGNTVKDVIHDDIKLAHLEGFLPHNAKIFVDCLRGIADVHHLVTSPTLDSDFENIISNFILKWKELEDIFSIGCTLKIHIIGTHLLDVLKETGKTLHDESDEPVEQAHYRVNDFEKKHGYYVSDRKMATSNAGIRQQRMMEHLNSYHLR